MDLDLSESSDNHDVMNLLDAIETLEMLLDDDILEPELSLLPRDVQERLHKLQERILALIPRREGPEIEEVVDSLVPRLDSLEPGELAFKCVCNECEGHIPVFQRDMRLSLDFHCQTEQHKAAVKKREMQDAEEANKETDKENQNNAKNLVFGGGDITWLKNKDIDVKRNDLNTDANKKQVFWNSLAAADSKFSKSFDGLPVQRHHIKSLGHTKAPKKKRLYVQGHPNHPKSLDTSEPVADTHTTASSQHSVNILLHIDTAAAAANSSQPDFPIHGRDVADAKQEEYVQRRLVDTEVLEKLKNRTLEYREELELMWGCVKHAEGDNWNNEHITKEGNVFHCHVCNEQLVSPYDVVLHVYGDDHLRDLGAYYCTVQ